MITMKTEVVSSPPQATVNYVPQASNDSLSATDVSVLVKKEIDRLIKEAIEDIKELLNAGLTAEQFESIDEQESETENLRIVDAVIDYLNSIYQKIYDILNLRFSINSYIQYLNLFSMKYNESGDPVVVLNISVEDNQFELEVVNVIKEQ